MGLPWVRLDANIASHDKMLDLLAKPNGHRAAAVYMFSLGWSGGHSTDGRIPSTALAMVHGRPSEAAALVDVGLWEPHPDGGWSIRNFAHRQELALVTEVKRRAQRLAAVRTNCIRWHGPECGCWQSAEGLPDAPQARVRRVK